MLTIDGEKYLLTKEVSQKFGVSVYWLRKRRYLRTGPPSHPLDNRIYYREKDVENWFKDLLKCEE